MSLLLTFAVWYTALTFFYLIYRYTCALIDNPLHWKKYPKRYLPSVSIIVPVYNEGREALEACIKSVCLDSYPKKEVIVVDDGSSDPQCWKTIQAFSKIYDFIPIQLPKNAGKRHAMGAGFRIAKNDVFIIMDSDTVVLPGSIEKLMQPLQDVDVGAVSGCVEVMNRNKNLLTKLQDARYWLAFQVEKASQNAYDGVTCTSGPFSAYRKTYLMPYLDEWEFQKFLGVECTYGDDRGLTTFMLKRGYKIKFVKDAIAETNVPENFRTFVKQQIRWKKSFCRENWYLLSILPKRNPFMLLEYVLFWIIFFLGFVAKVLAYTMVILNPSYFAGFIAMLVFVGTLHYSYALVRNPGMRGIYGMLFGFLNEFFLSWLFFSALFNLRDTRWGTR